MSSCGCTCSKLQQTRDHEWCLHSTAKAEFTNRSLLINHCLTNWPHRMQLNWPHRMQLAIHCHGSHVFMPLVGVVNWLYSICMQLANIFPWKKPMVPRSQGVPAFSFWSLAVCGGRPGRKCHTYAWHQVDVRGAMPDEESWGPSCNVFSKTWDCSVWKTVSIQLAV